MAPREPRTVLLAMQLSEGRHHHQLIPSQPPTPKEREIGRVVGGGGGGLWRKKARYELEISVIKSIPSQCSDTVVILSDTAINAFVKLWREKKEQDLNLRYQLSSQFQANAL